ncbi:MAG: ClpP family protease [Chloroflexota bacterium]
MAYDNFSSLPGLPHLQTVYEETPRGDRPFHLFDYLLNNRMIYLGYPIVESTASTVVAQLLYLKQKDSEAPISMYINSPGGQVYYGMAIYDTMQMISNPIHTVAVGMTASFGTVLLAAGSKGHRYSLPNATIHMHQPLGGAQGQATDIQIQAREILRLKERLNKIMAFHTGQTLEAVERDTERDFYMDAEAAVKYGLVDHVLEMPEGKKIDY